MKYNLQISVIILSAIALSIGIPAAINRTQAANVVVASGSEISPASNDAVSDNQSSDILASNDSATADSENISSEEVQNETAEVQTYSAVKSSSLATMQVGMVGVITAAGAEIPGEDTLLALADGTTTLDEVLGSGEAQPAEDEENTEPSEEDADVTGEDDDLDDAEGDEEYEEFGNLVIARVDSYVNVREGPSTDSAKLGKLYNNSVGELIRRTGDWLYISSGTVVGYVKAEYVVYGENAKGLIDEVMKKKATVTAGSLNFRSEPSKSGDVIKHLPRGGVYEVLGASEDGEWIKIKVDKKEGYVSAEYVTVASEFVSAESKEEEQARIAAEKEQARLEKEAEEQAKKAAEEEK
ncbi:MAG: SH3 domain-containing protein, partial [Lachnospiraceae bacterium]|nr:SH3 domain-containing protein [Candidatus Merdinaster equi]